MAHGITMITTAATIDMLAAIRTSRLSPGSLAVPLGMFGTSIARITHAPRFAADRSRTSRAWSRSPIVRQRSYESSWDYKPCGRRWRTTSHLSRHPITNGEWTIN